MFSKFFEKFDSLFKASTEIRSSESININGRHYSGKDIHVVNNKVIIDGKDVTPKDDKQIDIKISGNVEKLEVDVCSTVMVMGDVGKLRTVSGDVEVGGTVTGSISTVSGDVEVGGGVGGSVYTVSGDVSNQKKT